MCLFYSVIFESAAVPDLVHDVDYVHIQTLLGTDAPPGVSDGLIRLEADATDPEALDQVDGYLGPICAPYMD
jgi:hypothetical protein